MPDPTPTRAELLANTKRLAQVSTLATMRWEAHERECELCQDDDEDAEDVCALGLSLYTLAVAYECAVATVRGTMIWR